MLTIADDGAVELLAATDPLVAAAGEDDDNTLLLSAEFLQQALGATGPGQLRLSADGPIVPLAISRADATALGLAAAAALNSATSWARG
ncbi:hypothetical protein [Georgenia sp. MJ170]|uniref:hypothetical protein n=1 Tax=Georgenia sunbinii TaxID=3117728 RepID=UPI002F25ED39